MNEPIKEGDLVVVVKWPCCGKGLGRVATAVHRVRSTPAEGSRCDFCNEQSREWIGFELSDGWKVATAWLKRIPPLEELEDEKHREEISA